MHYLASGDYLATRPMNRFAIPRANSQPGLGVSTREGGGDACAPGLVIARPYSSASRAKRHFAPSFRDDILMARWLSSISVAGVTAPGFSWPIRPKVFAASSLE